MFFHIRRTRPATALLMVVFGVALFALPATSLSTGSPGIPSDLQVSQEEASSSHGLLFVENAGQWPDGARFQVWGSPAGVGTTWLAEDAIWISIVTGSPSDELERFPKVPAGVQPAEVPPTGVALKLTFPGSNPDVRLEPINPLTTTVSYFLGNDPTQWQPDVPVYTGVRYVDLYPGVNLVLGGSDGAWQLEAAPDAAVDQVRLLVEGALIEDLDGTELHLARDDERLSVALPRASFTYQVEGVSTQGETLALEFRSYRETCRQPIAPDDNPQDLVFGTFLGSDERDLAYALAVDETGQSTVAGYTQSSAFPTTPGAFDPSFNGALGFYDAFVARLSADGSTLVYGTFLGGSSNEIAYGIAVDNSGEATVTGFAYSSDFPTTPGAFDRSHNGWSGRLRYPAQRQRQRPDLQHLLGRKLR